MNGQQLATALRSGDQVLGTLIVSPSPVWPKALEGAGLDFVFIDTEHIPLDRQAVAFLCQLYASKGLAPVVRIAEPNATLAASTLDGGAQGIIAPYVETAAQVRELVGAVKMRPLKGRRLEEALDGQPLEPSLQEFLEEYNSQNCLIVNIESTPAMENLDEILAVDGLDGLLIGPHDLSCSLGVPSQYDHPKFKAAVSEIFDRARSAGRGAGIHFWGDLQQEIDWLRSGMNLLIHSGDITLFAKHLKSELNTIRAGVAPKGHPLKGPHTPQTASEVVV